MNCMRIVTWSGAVAIAGLAFGIEAQGPDQAASTPKEGVVVQGNLKGWKSMPGLQGLERAFEYLTRTDLAALPLGRTPIDGDDVFVQVSETATRAPDETRFEAHRRYIDIQVVVRGQEAIGVAPTAALGLSAGPYDTARDIEFFGPPATWVPLALRPGEFVVFTPADGHRPGMHLDGPHVSRKAVVKVSVTYRDRHRAAAAR